MAMGLVMLCVAAWVGSYFYSPALYFFTGSHEVTLEPGGGSMSFCLSDNGWPVDIQLHMQPYSSQLWQDWNAQAEYHCGGFAYFPYTKLRSSWEIHIPFYFTTLLSAMLLWLIWRKTRAKYNGKGFPVEVAGSGKKVGGEVKR
jgi:hypothetical protein